MNNQGSFLQGDLNTICGFGIAITTISFIAGVVRSYSKDLLPEHHSSNISLPGVTIDGIINNLRPQFNRFKEAVDQSLIEGREIGYIIDNKYRLTGPYLGSAKGVTFDLTKEELEYMGAIGTFHTHVEREKPTPSRLDWMWMGIREDKIMCIGGKAKEQYYLYVALRERELPTGEIEIQEVTVPLR